MRFLTLSLLLFPALTLRAQSLEGMVDLHAHSGPDSVARSIDALDLARLDKARGFRAIVLKNHYESTAALAVLARKAAPGLLVFGSIALNPSVGGVNPSAVEHMAKVEGGFGRVVWMPTHDSENEVRSLKENRPFASVSKGGQLLPEVKAVLDLIARYHLVLATGHSTAEEDLMLIREARARGVRAIIVTHPLLLPVPMTMAQMKQAAALGAYLEFECNSIVGMEKRFTPADYVRTMRSVGVDHAVLSSDLGQAGNPLHPDGLETVFRGLRAAGMSAAEIHRVAKRNPARLLGLE